MNFCDFRYFNKASTGHRSAARFKPEVHPRSVSQKCTPEVYPGSVPQKCTPEVYPRSVSQKCIPEVYPEVE